MPRGKIGKSLAQVIAEFDRDFPLEMAEARRQLRSEPMTLEVTDITHVVFQQEIERLRHDIERHIAIASEHATECERLRAELAVARADLAVAVGHLSRLAEAYGCDDFNAALMAAIAAKRGE